MAGWWWRESPDDGRAPTGLVLSAGVVVVVVTAVVLALAAHTVSLRVGAITAAVLVFTAVAGDGRAASGVAVTAWAVGNGFLINHLGQLRWHGPVDTWFVMGLLGAVAVGMITSEVRREVRERRRWQPWRDLLAAQTVGADPAGDSAPGSLPIIQPGPRGGSPGGDGPR